MATGSNPTYCDLCYARHTTKPGEVYCLECEETLCLDCIDHHKVSKFTKSHQTVTLDEYNKLPQFIQQIKQYCEDHGDIFEFHCPVHDALCCKKCINSTHKKCNDTVVIEDLLKMCDSSATLDSIERTLQDIETNIDQVIKDRQQNLHDLQNQKKIVSTQIKEKRKEINKHLDKLEKDILKNLEGTEKETRKKIEHLISEIEKVQSHAKESKSNISLMKKYASSIQVFLGTRKLQEQAAYPKKYIDTLYENGSLNYKIINLLFTDQFCGLTKDITTFGNLEIKEDQTHLRLSWEDQKAAQIFTVPRKLDTIDDILLHMMRSIKIYQLRIQECLLFRDKDIYLTTQDPKLVCKYDAAGTFVSSFKMKGSAFGILRLDNKSILVTNGDLGKSLFKFDVDLSLTKEIEIKSDWLYGATLQGSTLISCTHENGIKCFKMSNDNVTSGKVLVELEASYTYITSDSRYLYHSNYRTNSITCYDLDGKSIWSFKDNLLETPKGITTDLQSNIYVAGFASNNVVVISPDGKRARQLLGPCDGLIQPCGIHYDKDSNHLLVSNYSGRAFLYKVN